jgi:predicted Zn-dependent protease
MRKGALLACSVSVILAGAPAASGEPQIGKILRRAEKRAEQLQSLRVNEQEEIQLGEAVSEKIRVRYGVVQDAAVHKYVTLVGTVLVENGSRPNLPWHFIVLDTDGVNAFAAPGGYIHVTRGALALIHDEAELAAVLAHEIAHVTDKHTVEAIQKSNAIQIGASETLRDREVFNRVVDKTAEIVMAGFGRAEELEADRDALRVANGIGYAPGGLGAFLTRLTERNKESSGKQGLYSSHPEMKERLERLGRQIAGEHLASTILLDARYTRHISYKPKPQAEVAGVVDGAAGLTSGGQASTPPPPPKKKGIGLSNLLKPSGSERKSAEVTGSGASRGVDTERGARGGSNPTLVTVNVTEAEVAAFRKEGNLK